MGVVETMTQLVEPYTKAELKRRRLCPISERVHTIQEVAALVQLGKTYQQIAALWGMRPQAGKDDLRYQVHDAWKEAGNPGGIPRPVDEFNGDSPEWQRWRAARDRAIDTWLKTMSLEDITPKHCPTCRCSVLYAVESS